MPQDQKRRFLLHLVVSLHSYGDTTHRTEYLIAAVAEKLGVRADIGAFPNFVLVSFIAPDGDPTKSELHHLPISGGLDLDKLASVDAVCQVCVCVCVNTLNRVMEFVCAFFVGFLTRVC